MPSDDTRLHKAGEDTSCFGLRTGQRVRIATGSLAGIEGIVVEQRAMGRILITIMKGVQIEIHQFCLEALD